MAESNQKTGYNFGTFAGVLTPSLLTILGVIMYLRFGWILGQMGLLRTLIIVTVATSITFLTALSISQIATNMHVKGGGGYYIISRSLGLEAGAAIGLPLFFAKSLGVSFYIVGFAESVSYLTPNYSVTSIGIVTLVILSVITYFSADWAIKFQFVIFAFIFGSLISFFMGSFHPAQIETVKVIPFARVPFWGVFAVFFPAVTGIEAGLSLSGDLKNPERALPLGTLGAVGISFIIYMAIPVFFTWLKIPKDILTTHTMIMQEIARWGWLILAGLWGAILSSAIGSMLGAPRTLQALAQDGLIPHVFAKGWGRNNDPRFATLLSFAVALVGIVAGNLNSIAPILSMFFLTTYGILNLSAALEGIIANPSWRPKFKVHWIWPALGAVGCLMVMFMINSGFTFVALFVTVGVYLLIKERRLNAYWGDLRYGILMYLVRMGLYRLADMTPHEKTWRPNILVLSGAPSTRWYLIELADAISHGKGFLTVALVLPEQQFQTERIDSIQNTIRKYLKDRFIPAIVKVLSAEDPLQGAHQLIDTYGFGALIPNTILLGGTEKEENFVPYANLLKSIADRKKNLIVVREPAAQQELIGPKRIDLWWRRVGDNSGLMLALAYLLKTSPEWIGATLCIKTIVSTEEEKMNQYSQLSEFVKKENMQAEIRIYVHTNGNIFNTMRTYSEGASLVFLGLRAPEDAETAETYAGYYTRMLQSTEGYPTVAFVLASEEINFDKIFQLREGG